ncbi:KATNB1-like protein 1 isoform X1 [Conger conger]|uniref:KATNB1-like protein 1 isoform X1 n=1 Tax=Conger conger TaxID=82655 RepID=UPI002A5AFF4D|nr:KATNB1-like protein 1 isoform X1 [Conger conger]XP_061098852.1 KATNB1-like protein 1 isoform X1 [Conger conger]
MASGNDIEEREFKGFQGSQASEALKHWPCSVAEKNMRKVDFFNKEEINKKRSSVGRPPQNSSKAKRVSYKRKTCHVPESAAAWRRGCDMANKENELTCAEAVQEVVCSDHCGLPLNLVQGAKMEGPGSKYSEYFTELSKDHDVMTHVLFGRNLRLNVALTLWRRNANELVAYLIRIQDPGVLVDCLPVITKSLQDDKPLISIGCCVDLLPLVKTILASKYEEYLIVGLHWVQSVIKKWWPELSVKTRSPQDSRSDDWNVQIMKQQLQELWERKRVLSLVPGTTGEIAKGIETYLSQLH